MGGEAERRGEPLVELFEDLGDAGEVERNVILEHEQVEVEGDERALRRCALLGVHGRRRYELLSSGEDGFGYSF